MLLVSTNGDCVVNTKGINSASEGRPGAAGVVASGSCGQVGSPLPTIKRLELADGEIGGRADTGEKLMRALEEAGVIFVAQNGEGAGVRLKRSPDAGSLRNR